MKTALTLLTCDKVDLVRQSLQPLLEGARAQKFDLFIADGSTSEANEKAIWEMSYPTAHMTANVRGGAGAAIVFALTEMLKHPEHYDAVGLVESDVLLRDNWLDCLDLFRLGKADGLEVGAVSARAYADRVLFQRNGYAVMHNTGAGMIVLTRDAARIVLDTFRTAWTTDNRRIFAQLTGIDIGSFWAFRFGEHYLTADWHWDAALAAHGLASLALTPSPVEMIGQNPPLAEQGLTLVKSALDMPFTKNTRFEQYADNLDEIRKARWGLGVSIQFHYDVNSGTWTYFPHQMYMLGGAYQGDWRLRECRGWGTFAWVAGAPIEDAFNTNLTVPVFGPCVVLVSGGKTGGKVEVVDEGSGFKASPDLPPEGENGQVLQMQIPSGLSYRNIRITALTPGCVFYGIQTREKQPSLPGATFDYSNLPSV